MRAYLKNGQTVRIDSQAANEIVNMQKKGDEDILVRRSIFNGQIHLMINVNEVIAIR